jgi:hypothetical protein
MVHGLKKFLAMSENFHLAEAFTDMPKVSLSMLPHLKSTSMKWQPQICLQSAQGLERTAMIRQRKMMRRVIILAIRWIMTIASMPLSRTPIRLQWLGQKIGGMQVLVLTVLVLCPDASTIPLRGLRVAQCLTLA